MEYVESAFVGVFCFGMLRHTYTDVREMLLYDSVNLWLLIVGVVRAFYYGILADNLMAAGAVFAVMMAVYLLSRGGMGEGDVKLSFVLGLWLGMERGIGCLLLAFVAGAVCGVALLCCGKCGRRQALPFGPFLCASAVGMYFWGAHVIAWYWGMMSSL